MGSGLGFLEGFLFAFTAGQRGIFFFSFQAHKNKEKIICLFLSLQTLFYSPRTSEMETGGVWAGSFILSDWERERAARQENKTWSQGSCSGVLWHPELLGWH